MADALCKQQCTYCAKECDPASEFYSVVDCGIPSCGRCVYHTNCLEVHLRRTKHKQGASGMAGYLCPRGRGKVEGKACNGRICATFRRTPPGQKQQQAVASVTAHMNPRSVQPKVSSNNSNSNSNNKVFKARCAALLPPLLPLPAAGEGVAARMAASAVVTVPGMEVTAAYKPRRRRGAKLLAVDCGNDSERCDIQHRQDQDRGPLRPGNAIEDVDTYNAILLSCGVPPSVVFSEQLDEPECVEVCSSQPSPHAGIDVATTLPTEDELFALLGYIEPEYPPMHHVADVVAALPTEDELLALLGYVF